MWMEQGICENGYTVEWSTERMKIIVAIKQVPVRDSSLRIDASGRWIDEEDLSYEINEPDAYALEEALQLKEKHGGEVVAVLAGPERGSQTIREALAKGADRAIHIECDDLASLDTLGIASRLAAAIKDEKADLILTGLQSDDLGLGQTGVVLAELLGIPHATIIMQVEVEGGGEGNSGAGAGSGLSIGAGSGVSIKVKRELEDGWFQHVEMPLPALLTIQSGISKLRYATLMGIKKAKTKEVRRIAAGDLPQAAAPTVTLGRIYLPEKKKETQLIEGSPNEAAAKLVEKLKFEVRVI
jgi:electron transfer flavoprotein beta subunit